MKISSKINACIVLLLFAVVVSSEISGKREENTNIPIQKILQFPETFENKPISNNLLHQAIEKILRAVLCLIILIPWKITRP